MSQIRKARSDVIRHRANLVDAASRVFSEQGVQAPLEMVAELAGVARATLYRHFPDRTALLLALFERDITPVLEAGNGLPPGKVLLAMLTEMGRGIRSAPALEDAWRAMALSQPEVQARRAKLLACFEKPLADAIAAGNIRADLTLEDVIRVGRMVVAANRQAQGDEHAGGRILDLVLNGIRGDR